MKKLITEERVEENVLDILKNLDYDIIRGSNEEYKKDSSREQTKLNLQVQNMKLKPIQNTKNQVQKNKNKKRIITPFCQS